MNSDLDEGTRRTLLWLRRVKELTPFSPIVQQAMAALDDERSSAKDLARIIGQDEAMASKILRIVNSAFYGMRGKATTVSHAVTLMGFDQIRMLIVGVAVFEQTRLRDRLADSNRRQIWEHSSACASWTRELAAATRFQPVEEASLVALLHDVGKIVLGVSSPADFALAVERSKATGIPSYEAETSILGINHLEVGGMVAEYWRFPALVRQAIALHHSPWPPAPEEPGLDLAKLRHLVALVQIADRASKRSMSDLSPASDVSEIKVTITPEELIEGVRELDALRQG